MTTPTMAGGPTRAPTGGGGASNAMATVVFPVVRLLRHSWNATPWLWRSPSSSPSPSAHSPPLIPLPQNDWSREIAVACSFLSSGLPAVKTPRAPLMRAAVVHSLSHQLQ
eukprot:GHVU01056204.1.p2 GENE.GHVU01056204.1~~GHVU01056204.1.p2  ORF type:complete len:110 (+),score=8.18 GHVU01056204.1:86-415(+)